MKKTCLRIALAAGLALSSLMTGCVVVPDGTSLQSVPGAPFSLFSGFGLNSADAPWPCGTWYGPGWYDSGIYQTDFGKMVIPRGHAAYFHEHHMRMDGGNGWLYSRPSQIQKKKAAK